jgi:hypothetical protein
VGEPALQLTIHVGGQISEALVLQRSELLARLIAFLVEIFSRREEGRHFGSWRARSVGGRRHALLAPEELIVDIGTQFVELGGRQPKQLVSRLVWSGPSTVSVWRIQEPFQGHIVLSQNLFHPFVSSPPLFRQCSIT